MSYAVELAYANTRRCAMKNKIGVLGCFGTIGRHTVEKLLSNGFSVIGAQRRKSDMFDGFENFRYCKVDVSDTEELNEFCKKCDVVINCISPAYIYGSLVAKSAARANSVYIDGVDFILKDKTLPENGVYIMAAGYVPGLSEFIPKAIIKNEFDKAERLVIYQGGTELCSEAAFADIVLSANDSGYSDCVYSKSKIVPFHISIRNKMKIPDFPCEALIKAFLSHEMVSLAEKTGLSDLYWFNAYQDMFFVNLLLRAMRCSIGYEKNEAAEKIRECMRKSVKGISDGEPYTIIGMEIQGVRDGKTKRIHGCLYLKNSSRICGYVLAQTAMDILESGVNPGVYYAYEIIENDYLDKLIYELETDEYLIIEEIPEDKSILLKIPFINK